MNHPGKFVAFKWVSAIRTSKDATGASFVVVVLPVSWCQPEKHSVFFSAL